MATTKKPKAVGVNGSGFSQEDWEHLERLAESDKVVFSLFELVKTIYPRVHVQSFEALTETINFLNESLLAVTKMDEQSKPYLLDNNKEKEFDSILKVAASIPKLNIELQSMKDSLISDVDEQSGKSISRIDKWANEGRK
jgi:hypothetical protein